MNGTVIDVRVFTRDGVEKDSRARAIEKSEIEKVRKDLADQQRCVELFTANMPGENLYHAKLHRDTIACFGRFPWRNDALGRQPTPAETRVMEAGGYGALVSGKLSLADVTEMI